LLSVNSFLISSNLSGGGSAGVAAAKLAAKSGAKVALADYVTPSPQGTQWGLGGTCINVGCIPKKLFHYASNLGESKADLKATGWDIDVEAKHDWNQMVEGASKYIRNLRWNAKLTLAQNGIKYYEGLAKFLDDHNLEVTIQKKTGNTVEKVSAKYILISTGGRPTYPDIPGAKEYAISSDDVFYLKKNPGKTLLIGASYIALESAGFLKGIGNDVTVMVRSILLRGFDQDCAKKVGSYLEKVGVKFINESVPTKIEKLENGNKLVHYQNADGETLTEEFETVLFAIGRTANTVKLGLEAAGVKVNPKNLKVLTNDRDETNIPHIFALGDVSDGRPELTPPAVMAGKMLAARLFKNSTELMNYKYIATTVFTPLEYGAVGYSEEDAKNTFGAENVVSYHSTFKPLEWIYNDSHPTDNCYVKIVTHGPEQKIVGMHFVGPNAGEVIQGFGVAVKAGITKSQLDSTVGIHPTNAEEILELNFKTTDEISQSEGCKGCGF
jgi:thioredoxin reductase (NADPH)